MSPAPLPCANLPGFKGLPEVSVQAQNNQPIPGFGWLEGDMCPRRDVAGRAASPGPASRSRRSRSKGGSIVLGSRGGGAQSCMLGLLEGKLSANTHLSKEISNASLPGAVSPFRSREAKV